MQSKPQSPLFTVQPDLLPYPYQKRKVNFTSYSGVKTVIPNSMNGYRSQSSLSPHINNNTGSGNMHEAPAPQNNAMVLTKKIAPVVSSNVHNLSYRHSNLSSDGEELHNNEHDQRKHINSNHTTQHSTYSEVDDGSAAVAWLMSVSKKEASQLSQGNLAPQTDFSRSHTDFPTVLLSQDKIEDLDQFSARPGSRESLSRAELRQEFAEQQQHPGSPKPNQLRGVTLLQFQGQSTVSPYLDHLTTTNPAMGNAVLAITRLNLGGNPVYLPSAAKTPKGFAIINDERPNTGHNLKSIKSHPHRGVKSANGHRDDVLRSTVPGPADHAGYGHTPTALERVTAFKARIPDSASTLEARALRVQHNTWGQTSSAIVGTSKAAKNVQSAHNFNSRSGLQDDGRLGSPSIDLLVSAQRFPNSPVQMTSPTFRFDETDGPDQFASTVDLGSTASRLQLGASMDRPRTSSPSDVLHGIHKDPLYKVLREECEILRRRPFGATQTIPSSDTVSASPIADGISTSEIKALRCFTSLPPAVWITTRIVFFLLAAYQECFLGEEGQEALRVGLGMAKIFDVLERQARTDNIRLETIERLYSWPYFQAILTSPRLFIKALKLIEGGGLPVDNTVGDQRQADFFESYPVEKLQHLRELIRHGQGLFQESAVISIVPVCAKLCSWAKKVIAAIYSACLERIRVDEQMKMSSLMPQMTLPMDNTIDDPERRGTKKNHFTSSSSVELSRQTGQLHASLHSGGRIVAGILPHKLVTSVYSTHNVADSYSVAMSLAQPATAVDLVLLAPIITDPTTTAPVDMSEMRKHYEGQLRERAASPLHRVTTLSDQRFLDVAAENSVVSYLHLDNNDRMEDNSAVVASSRPQEVRVRLHGSGADILVHPLVSHCLAPDVAADLLVVDRVFCRSVGLLRADKESGNNNKARNSEARLLMESGQLVSSFSLVLVPPLTTKAGAFVSTAAGEVWSLDDEPPGQTQQSVGGGFAQANNYVVCVTESASSWSAFQLARRLAKPSDTVSVVHVPFLDMSDPQQSAADMGCSRRRYDQQRTEAVARIARLTAQYRAVDHNLYVDALPDYFEVAERAAGYFFQRKSLDRKLRKTPPFTLSDGMLADSYQRNQEKFYLAKRLLAVAHQFEPNFLLLGADSADIALGMSTAHGALLSHSFPCSSKKTWSSSSSGFSRQQTATAFQTSQITKVNEPLKADTDDADSVGFIYNDSTVLSNTYDSFDAPTGATRKGSNRASFMSALDNESNIAVEEERGMYEGEEEEDAYENDSFVGVDNQEGEGDPLYGADSFSAEDTHLQTQVHHEAPASPGDLSYSASVLPEVTSSKIQPKDSTDGLSVEELQRSFAEIQAEHVISTDIRPSVEELGELQDLQSDYMSFRSHPVQLVEMLLHTVESGKVKGDNDSFSIVLSSHHQKRTIATKSSGV